MRAPRIPVNPDMQESRYSSEAQKGLVSSLVKNEKSFGNGRMKTLADLNLSPTKLISDGIFTNKVLLATIHKVFIWQLKSGEVFW